MLFRSRGSVTSIAWVPHGGWVASCSYWDGTVKVWSAPGLGGCSATIKVSQVWSLAVSPDSRLLAAGCFDGKVHLLTPDGTVKEVLEGHTDSVKCVCFDGPGDLLASASQDRTARVWTLDHVPVEQVVRHPQCECVVGRFLTLRDATAVSSRVS